MDFFAAAGIVREYLATARRYAELEESTIPLATITPDDRHVLMTVVAEHDDDLFRLACLLVADRAGLYSVAAQRVTDFALRELTRLSIRFGLYERALSASRRVAVATSDSNHAKRNARLLEAKAHRGLGDYEHALLIYRDILRDIHDDEIWVARLLLQIGKVAHNFHWRTGFFREMVTEAKARLEAHHLRFPNTPEVIHSLGICYDSIAWINMEMGLLIGEHLDENLAKSIQLMNRAVALAHEVGDVSLSRRIFRLCYMRFFATSTATERCAALADFQFHMDQFADGTFDPRGLGVRYGQLADMQIRVGNAHAALDSLERSRRFAHLVSDYRTLARSWIRSAEARDSQQAPVDDCLHCLHEAQQALGYLRGQHPEIELDAQRRESRLWRKVGDYHRALDCLTRAIEILESLELRVMADYRQHTNPDFCPAEREIVSTEAWVRLGNALVVDYQMISRLQRLLLRESIALAQWGVRKEGLSSQLDFLAEYQLGWQHRLKNLLSLLHDTVPGDIEIMQLSQRGTRPGMVHMAELVSQWIQETQRDLSLLRSRGEGWVSVGDVVRTLSLPPEEAADAELKLDLEVVHDFWLWSHRPLLRQVLTHLIENAARVLRRHDMALRRIVVRVRVELTCNDGYVCCIEIEDSAGKTDELVAVLKRIDGTAIESDIDTPVSGLLLVSRFFERFHARMTAERTSDGMTRLLISLRQDRARVRLDDTGPGDL